MHFDGCDYLSMFGLKLNHISKMAPRNEDAVQVHVTKSFVSPSPIVSMFSCLVCVCMSVAVCSFTRAAFHLRLYFQHLCMGQVSLLRGKFYVLSQISAVARILATRNHWFSL